MDEERIVLGYEDLINNDKNIVYQKLQEILKKDYNSILLAVRVLDHKDSVYHCFEILPANKVLEDKVANIQNHLLFLLGYNMGVSEKWDDVRCEVEIKIIVNPDFKHINRLKMLFPKKVRITYIRG